MQVVVNGKLAIESKEDDTKEYVHDTQMRTYFAMLLGIEVISSIRFPIKKPKKQTTTIPFKLKINNKKLWKLINKANG